MIQTDNAGEFDKAVGHNVAERVAATLGSLNKAAQASGIAYATLHRKVKGHSSFTVRELASLAAVTGRRVSDFLPAEVS